MTTIFRTRPAGWRERLALRLIGTTPLVANVVIGPDYTSVGTGDGRQILAHRMVFDVSDFERQIAALDKLNEGEAGKRRGGPEGPTGNQEARRGGPEGPTGTGETCPCATANCA